MNRLSLVIAIIQACAAAEAVCAKNYKLAALWVCYSAASCVMAFMK